MGGIFLIPEYSFPKAVNLSVTPLCNYNCKFCFGQFRGLACWPDDSRIMEIPGILSEEGTEKLTFTGGEPFLYPSLDQLIYEAKKRGLTTSIVTNGSLITKERLVNLSSYLDWLAISIDSVNELTEIALGRGNGSHVKNAKQVSAWAHDLGIRLKTNSVVTKLNYKEDITPLLISMKPERAKFFQVLPIEGENSSFIRRLSLCNKDFMEFVSSLESLEKHSIKIIAETSEDMTGSYAMMLPDGTFFSNYGRKHIYGTHSILDIEPGLALTEVGWDISKFLERGGQYEWGGDKNVNRK